MLAWADPPAFRRVLAAARATDWELYARNDMYRIGPEDESREIEAVYRARDLLGDYPLHCHNTVHEDHGMMILFNVVA